MESRRWIFFLFAGLILVIISARASWQVFSIDDRLRKFIVAELRPYFEGDLIIAKLSIKPNSISLQDVSLQLPKQSIQLDIKKIQLGFSPINALKYNFSPIRLISKVVLEEPEFRIHSGPQGEDADDSKRPQFDIERLKESYEARLPDIKFVGSITIKDGQVVWVDSTSEGITLVNKLNGWLSTSDLEKSNVRLRGRLFGSANDNIILTGQANLAAGHLDSIAVTFFDDNLSTTIPTIFPEILKIEKGELVGRGVLREADASRLALDGEIELKNANLTLFGGKVKLDNFTTNAKINDWDLELSSCKLESFESPIVIKGSLLNILDPSFNLTVFADSVDLGRVFNEIWEEEESIGPTGLASAVVHISEAASNPKFSGEIAVQDFGIFEENFKSVKTRFSYQNMEFAIESVRARYQEFDLAGRGKVSIDPESPAIDMDIRASTDLRRILDKGLNPDLQDLSLILNGSLKSDFEGYSLASKFEMLGLTAENDSIPLNGSLSIDDGAIQLTATNVDGPFKMEARILPKSNSFQFNGKLDYFGGNLWMITDLPVRKQLKSLLDLSCEFTGDQNYATYELTAHRKVFTRDDLLFKIDGFYSSSGNSSNIEGDITYQPDTGGSIPGFIQLEFGPDSLKVKDYRLGDFYSAQASFDLSGERRISGNLALSDVDMTYIIDGVLLNPGFGVLGMVNGDIQLSGTLDKPVLKSDVSFSDVIIRGRGYYAGDALMELSDNTLYVEQLILSKENQKLLSAGGSIDLVEHKLNIDATGKEADLATILNLLIGDIDFIEGKANFDVTVRNTFNEPEITGEISAKDGRLFFVLYDSLKLQVGKSESNNKLASLQSLDTAANGAIGEFGTNGAAPGFYFGETRLVKKDQYVIEGSGYLPYSTDEDVSIDLSGKGDAFAVIFGDEPFVKESQSDATFSWGFGGTYSDMVYTKGEVKLRNGKVKLEEIAPEVDDIEFEVRFEPENQFVSVSKMTGVVGGEYIFAANSLADTYFDEGMEPLLISDWGLNFGAILLNTGEKGIPLNITGAMRPGEEGWFVVKGKAPRDHFIISGPEEHPVAKGEIFASNASFTFPFEFEEPVSTEPSLIEEILESMVWDVRLVPIKDIRYVKEIPGIVDNIWINAGIDPKISELNFSGIIEDESFRTEGLIQSTRGTIEYLDFNFGVEKFAAEFDRSDIYPIVYGRARTTFTDSVGIPSNIYMTVYIYDPETKQELERGRWNEDIRFKLSSDNPTVGTNEIQVLATLGYTPTTKEGLQSKAKDVIGFSTDHRFFRPLFRPVERKLERTLGLDAIRFRSRFARNFIDLNSDLYAKIDPRYLIFRSTQVTIGKYLSEDLFLLYSGQLETGLDPKYQEEGIGMKHTVDLEYRINPNLLLELQYNYDSLLLLQKEDKRVQIRHSFIF